MTRQQDMTKYQSMYLRTPGLSQFCDLECDVVRGLYATNNFLYAVGDDKFYQIDSEGNATQKGTLSTTSGRVSLTSNFTQVGFVDGTNSVYVYNVDTDSFTTGALPNGATTKRITFQDAYGIMTLEEDTKFQISGVSDLSTYAALDQGSVSSSAQINQLVGVESSKLELWLFGDVRTEVWVNAGLSPGVPYEKNPGVYIEMGCAGRWTVEVMDNTVIWLGRDERGKAFVCRADGYRPTVISSEPLHTEFETYERVDDAFSYSYTEAGHTFYVLTFPTANRTWVYDIATQMWHQRSSFFPAIDDSPSVNVNRHIANCYAFFQTKHMVGDFNSGKIYQMSREFLDDAGTLIYRERIFPTISYDQKRVFISKLYLDIQAGNGLVTGQGSDPQIMLQVQRDGVWGNERWKSAGAQGERGRRVFWPRLGQGRYLIPKISMTDPVDWVLLDASAEITVGTG